MKTKAINQLTSAFLAMFVVLMFAFSACSSDDSGDDPPAPEYSDDAFPPGYVWTEADYPSLTAPLSINEDVGKGSPILKVTELHKGDFHVTATRVFADWHTRAVRNPTGCGSEEHEWHKYDFWSDEVPNCIATFYNGLCTNRDLNYDPGWSNTTEKKFKFVDHGVKNLKIVTPSFNYNPSSGGEFLIYKNFEIKDSNWTDVYLSMERDWIVGDDITRMEGEATVEIYKKVGVSQINTTEFTETLGLDLGVEIEGISAEINQTFTTTSTQTSAFTTEDSIKEVRHYNIPPNEQWRYITLYGIERFKFTNANGVDWTSTSLVINPLGMVENKKKTFLMIVKYTANSNKIISNELFEIGDNLN